MPYLFCPKPCTCSVFAAGSLSAPVLQSLFKQLHIVLHIAVKTLQMYRNCASKIHYLESQETHGCR